MAERNKVFAAVRVDPRRGIKLAKVDTGSTRGVEDKKTARALLSASSAELDKLQYKLYAESKTALLIVFQAMDTAGKDGVIRKVFTPINPQGVRVSSFKQPTEVEKAHDYLWRIHPVVPAKGMIGIFNRSHYEDVLVYRVHKLLGKEVLEARYRQINDFERYLAENGVRILKFFLHISKDEQKRRLEERLEDKDKRWKFSSGDLAERKFWDKYQEAYETMLNVCSTKYAPWYVIPADNKWYRDWLVSSIVVEELKDINPRFPKPQEDLNSIVVE